VGAKVEGGPVRVHQKFCTFWIFRILRQEL
jgi:hypothetical protein